MLGSILRWLYPTAHALRQFAVTDDGAGAYISRWEVPGVPQPTEAEVLAQEAAFLAAGGEQHYPRELAACLLELLQTPEGKAMYAIVALLVDGEQGELNDLRKWLRDFKAAVAGAGTLAALKTAVAALPNTPDRTLAQARAAILNKIRAGVAG